MKAVLQNFRSGELSVSEVPPPTLQPGGILVRNIASLVSAGTEKAVTELAKMNPVAKAKARPDLVRKVLSKAGQEGLLGTARIVMNLINNPLPLGYSCAGIVQAVGEGVSDISTGDRVACAGLGHANHAEVVFIPRNLAVVIPEPVRFDEAAFVTVGAIAMQGVRQAEVRVGESVVVIGLGLVGQLAAQICRAAGCKVFGVDIDPAKVKLALEIGIQSGVSLERKEAAIDALRKFTNGRGADAILITAATQSSQPVQLAAELARDRARVVSLGETGLDIPRRAYYEKELDIRLSRSYGPGRYDASYEEKGNDYPIGYVRWTENRNMEAFLELIAERKIQTAPLVTHRFPIDRAHQAYDLLAGRQKEPYIGILLHYDPERDQPACIEVTPAPASSDAKMLRFGIIGAGRFAQGILLPNLRSIHGIAIEAVATGSGLTAKAVGEKYGARFCTSDYREILSRDNIQTVLIATRHHLHAGIAAEALRAGKHVFLEKPLAIDRAGLAKVEETINGFKGSGDQMPVLFVGYNRRFSPLAAELKRAFDGAPLMIHYRVNAGPVPADHWTQDPKEGGGRIVGEVCHFVDLIQFLADSEPAEVFAWPLGGQEARTGDPDSLCVQLRMRNGSIGSIIYSASGDPTFPKERIEVLGGGNAGFIENWRSLEVRIHGKRRGKRAILNAEKGHAEELACFVEGVRNGFLPIPIRSLLLTTKTTFAIQESIRYGKAISLDSQAC